MKKGSDLEDVVVWLGLMILLGLTLLASFAKWGTWSTILSFTISAAKAALIAYFFMHLRKDRGMTRIFAVAGLSWLTILFSLSLSDYLSRGWLPFPSRWPIWAKLRPGLMEQSNPDERAAPRPGGFGVGR